MKKNSEKEIIFDKPKDDTPTFAKKRESALERILKAIGIDAATSESKKERKPMNRKRMVNFIAICVAVIIIIVLSICLAVAQSPKDKSSNTDEIIAQFKNVEELQKAIKSDPHKYDGKRVSVIGTISSKHNNYAKLSYTVAVYFEDKLKFSVLEENDFVEVEGIISIQKNGSIEIEDATYTFRNTVSEEKMWHQDDHERYVLTFSVKDFNDDNIAVTGTVKIKITNDGEVVYEKTHEIDEDDFRIWYYDGYTIGKYQATIYINDSEIEKGLYDDGKMTFSVVIDDYAFKDYTFNITGLPQETAE